MTRTRYALVGTGERGIEMYLAPIATEYTDVAETVGVLDANPLRAAAAAAHVGGVPVFDRFETMLLRAQPDVVIVASRDDTHDGYIVDALRAGCRVITEKPLAIDAERCRAIVAAERENACDVRVAFNYRYAPAFGAVKERLADGVVGDVRSVDFHWYLDTAHGADYFRRWHRRLAVSGGLFVHKATHHFDLVNWWLDDRPEAVAAEGRLLVYGHNGTDRGERCLTCTHASTCAFAWDLRSDPDRRALYLETEAGDGYRRDGCVFDPEIDIYDTMAAMVRFTGGAVMSYSLTAYAAYEGMRVAFNGTRGRLELEVIESRQTDADDLTIHRFVAAEPGSVVRIPRVDEGHAGADHHLREELFRGPLPDPLGRAAGVMDGVYSVLTGAAANRSVAEGGWVRLDDLLGESA
jgi:predicted dehydrogenase